MCYSKRCVIKKVCYPKGVLSKRCVILLKVCYRKRCVIPKGVLSTEGVLNYTPWVSKRCILQRCVNQRCVKNTPRCVFQHTKVCFLTHLGMFSNTPRCVFKKMFLINTPWCDFLTRHFLEVLSLTNRKNQICNIVTKHLKSIGMLKRMKAFRSQRQTNYRL